MKKLVAGLGMVAGGLLLLLMIGSIPMFSTTTDCGPNTRTPAYLNMLSVACEAYAADGQRFPAQIDNKSLVKILTGDNATKYLFELPRQALNADGEMLDGWKTPLRVVINANGSLTFISAGADKKFGTKDDLSRTTPILQR